MCLSIWRRSPKAYEELQKSGMLKLPSGRLLQYHKNITSQEPGCNEDVLQWMVHEAEKKNIGPAGKIGGIILDEMAIQVLFLDNLFDCAFNISNRILFHERALDMR